MIRFATVAIALAGAVLLAPQRLEVRGSRFVAPNGTPFDWRGVTAFRLVEMVAHGEEHDADAYLAWAAAKKLTVVRVLAMAEVLFKLSPADGQRGLPRLLDMARGHGLRVEVVALADTAAVRLDIPQQVKAIGQICGRYDNVFLEIANEPGHPSHRLADPDRRGHSRPGQGRRRSGEAPRRRPAASRRTGGLRGRARRATPMSEHVESLQPITWHAPRSGSGGWPAQIARGARLVRRFGKPVINDEPMGAADRPVPGRRDNDPARFRAAAVASRRAGLGATFHYEGGLQARLPTVTELACLDAWLAGLSAGR